MRIGILSDIHANREALEATLADMRGAGVERVVCLGDVVGYNTDPSPCIALLREAGAVCIAGNHDRAVTRQIPTDGFSVRAIRAIAWTRKRLPPEDVAWLSALPLKTSVGDQLVAVHGALHVDRGCELVRLNSDDRLRRTAQALLGHPSGARVCAYGHTHRLGIHEYRNGELSEHDPDSEVALRGGSCYLLNPGTVGEPRSEERRATWMLFDTGRRTVSVRRVAYDDRAAFDKTRRAGIEPRRLLSIPAPLRAALQGGLRRMGIYEMVRRVINS
ncbi:metallophosphoesterase [Azospirillum brasilense]|nr:metallophosphoesterase [Azospirillum brasilense]